MLPLSLFGKPNSCCCIRLSGPAGSAALPRPMHPDPTGSSNWERTTGISRQHRRRLCHGRSGSPSRTSAVWQRGPMGSTARQRWQLRCTSGQPARCGAALTRGEGAMACPCLAGLEQIYHHIKASVTRAVPAETLLLEHLSRLPERPQAFILTRHRRRPPGQGHHGEPRAPRAGTHPRLARNGEPHARRLARRGLCARTRGPRCQRDLPALRLACAGSGMAQVAEGA